MSHSPVPLPSNAPGQKFRLPDSMAFYLQGSIVVFFLAGSSAPTPLYPTYQSQWGFSAITTTIVFGVYAVAVLVALLVVGSLSDFIGRRPILLVAIVVQALSMLAFAAATGVGELMVIRVVQGLATGSAVAAVGAGLLDLDRTKGTLANSVAAPIGTALGALGSGLLVQYLPAPTHLVYLVLSVIFVLQGIGVAFMRETASPRSGALSSLRITRELPSAIRKPMLVVAPALIAIWALLGFYGSLAPAVVRNLIGHNSALLGGLALFAVSASGAASVVLFRNRPPRSAMFAGVTGLMLGVAITLLATDRSSTTEFFLGTVIAGIGFGAGFHGAIRSIVAVARPHERAGVLSILYVVSYLAMGLPAVIAGFLVVHGGGVAATARDYGIAVIVVAALALLGLTLARPPVVARSSVSPAFAPVPQSVSAVGGDACEPI